MQSNYQDLQSLLAQARRSVADDRFIWCCASDTFESTITVRRGMLLGGALSPHFLRDTDNMWSNTPWTVRLERCRVAVCSTPAAQEPLQSWVPVLEGAVKAGESFLVIAEAMGSEMIRTLAVNLLKGTLGVCAVKPARTRYGQLEPGIESLGMPAQEVPARPDKLPLVPEVWIRRTAAVIFPALTDTAPDRSSLRDFAIIETGGENHEDQYDRLRWLMRELQKPA